MPNNALDWKEKYLTLLDQQETLEAHFALQTDLLNLETAQPQAVALTKVATPGFFGRLFKANESTVLNNETAEPNHETAQQQVHNAEPTTPADADTVTVLDTPAPDKAIAAVRSASADEAQPWMLVVN